MPKTAAQKRAANLAKKRGLTWLVRLDTWDFSLSFGPAWQKQLRLSWSEYAVVEVGGVFARMEKPLRPRLMLWIYSDRERDPLAYATEQDPRPIGRYQVNREDVHATAWLPHDDILALAPFVAARRLQSVQIEADVPEYRRGAVRSLRITTTLDDEDSEFRA